MRKINFRQYTATIAYLFQLLGIILVGKCFFTGIMNGDYERLELLQFVAGTIIFFLGTVIRKRVAQK